ncbi:MAG: hypothetical protein ACN6OP_11160 [Pseudomonadales bacterium]
MLTIEHILGLTKTDVTLDESLVEGKADALLLADRPQEAAEIYKTIENPRRRVREKHAYCAYAGGVFPLEILDTYEDEDSSTTYGLEMQARSMYAAKDVAGLSNMTQWLLAQDGAHLRIAFLLAAYWIRFSFSKKTPESIYAEIVQHVRKWTANKQGPIYLDLAYAVSKRDEPAIEDLLAKVDLTGVPILATVYRAALLIGNKAIARAAVQQLASSWSQGALLTNTVSLCAFELRDWTLLELVKADPSFTKSEKMAVALARALDQGDTETVARLVAECDGDIPTGHPDVVAEWHTWHMSTCYVDGWDSLMELSDRATLLRDALPPGSLRGKSLYHLSIFSSYPEGHELELATLAYKEWPTIDTIYAFCEAGGEIDPTELAGLVIAGLDESVIDKREFYSSDGISLIEGDKKALKAYVKSANAAIQALPETRRAAVANLLFTKVYKKHWSDFFKLGLGGHIADLLHGLCYEEGMNSYAVDLAFAYNNIGRYADGRDALLLCDEPQTTTGDYHYISGELALNLDDYHLLTKSKQAIELLTDDDPANSERVKGVLPKIAQRVVDLAGTMLHVPSETAPSTPVFPSKLPEAVTPSVDALSKAMETLTPAELLALQVRLLELSNDISEVLPPARADKLVFQTWEAKHPGISLAPRGEQALQRAAKSHGHARVIMAMSEKAVVGEKDADGAMGALLKVLAQRAETGSNRIAYLIGIIRNRFSYVNTQKVGTQVKIAARAGVGIEDLIGQAKEMTTWTEWCDYINALAE